MKGQWCWIAAEGVIEPRSFACGSLGVLVSYSSSSPSSSKVLWLQDGSGHRRELEGAGG